MSPAWLPWLWLVPLALGTLWVWGEIALGWWPRRLVAETHGWRARLLSNRGALPCLFCHNVRHTWEEHVRYPQQELLMRDEDDLWRQEGGQA